MYKLKTKIAELEGDKSALMLENSDLKEKVNSLHLELSVKEAKWCEKEEQYKMKVFFSVFEFCFFAVWSKPAGFLHKSWKKC